MNKKYLDFIDEKMLKEETTIFMVLFSHVQTFQDAQNKKEINRLELLLSDENIDENEKKVREIQLDVAKDYYSKIKHKTEREWFTQKVIPQSKLDVEIISEQDYNDFKEAVFNYRNFAINRYFVEKNNIIPARLINNIVNVFKIPFSEDNEIEFEGYTETMNAYGYDEEQMLYYILAEKYNSSLYEPQLIIPTYDGVIKTTTRQFSESLFEEHYKDKDEASAIHYLLMYQLTPQMGLFNYKNHLYFVERNDLEEMTVSSRTTPFTQKLTRKDIETGIASFKKLIENCDLNYSQKELDILIDKICNPKSADEHTAFVFKMYLNMFLKKHKDNGFNLDNISEIKSYYKIPMFFSEKQEIKLYDKLLECAEKNKDIDFF